MHVLDSIRILLMLMSYVMQKTRRLTFEEKHKIIEFMGRLVTHSDFTTPRLSQIYAGSEPVCTGQETHLIENTSHNN
jgi:hypothetical protein